MIASGPDPEGAAPAFERFVDLGGPVPTSPEEQRLLVAILSSGSFLSDIILSDIARWTALKDDPYLRQPKPRALFVAEVIEATRGVETLADLQRALRLYRRAEMLRLGARELGWGTTMEVARELSGLADACLEAAVVFSDAALRKRFGPPQSPEGTPGFVVLAMGKLGGHELNFSSDVDLIYVYSTDEGKAGSVSLHEYYARLSQDVTRALADITDDGFVFRVDLRLRPEGRSGPICNSLPASERYYEAFGRTWERQALLRARPAAGDIALGERFLRTLEPFVYPRSVGPGTLDEVRSLRKLYQPTTETDGFNVKLGGGGIRDVELVAQVLELLHAGKRRELRERGTLPALTKLGLAGLLSDHEVRTLSEAYRFFRMVEHRIQLEHGSQTHALPAETGALDRMARRLGYVDGAELMAAIDRHRNAVQAVSATLGEPVGGPPAIVLRLLDPASSRERLEADLREAGFQEIATSADSLELVRGRLPAAWLEEAMASPDPDRALVQFRDLALRGSLGLFALLGEERSLLRMLAGLFGTSDRLSKHLIAHPTMWVSLVDNLGEPRPDKSHFQNALATRLSNLDTEEAMREMRRFQAEEILRVGLHDVAGNLGPDDVSGQLSALAQACVTETLRLVAAPFEERYGRPQATLTILAFGSFGAKEMRYGSDLDLVFLYSHPGTTDRGMDHQEWFARLAQRLINSLGARLDEGRLYEVDTRLRPSGEQGMLVTSYESFDRYHEETAAPWERAALLRARPVFVWGHGDEKTEFGDKLIEIAYQRPIDTETVRSELARVRARIENERVSHTRKDDVHLRFSAGGLTDLEFLVAFGQLRFGKDDPALRTTSPFLALRRLCDRDDAAMSLLDDYRFLQRASLRLRLLRDRPDDLLSLADRGPLARSLEMTETRFSDELATRMGRVRTAFERTLSVG